MTDDPTPQTFPTLVTFLKAEIELGEQDKFGANFMEKRRIEKKLKALKAILKKAEEVRGKK